MKDAIKFDEDPKPKFTVYLEPNKFTMDDLRTWFGSYLDGKDDMRVVNSAGFFTKLIRAIDDGYTEAFERRFLRICRTISQFAQLLVMFMDFRDYGIDNRIYCVVENGLQQTRANLVELCEDLGNGGLATMFESGESGNERWSGVVAIFVDIENARLDALKFDKEEGEENAD